MLGVQNIILCGGPINQSNLPIGTTQSNAMISVNGKPVISWILDDLLEKKIDTVTVVLREQDFRLSTFLRRVYSSRIDLHIATLSHEGTILQSLRSGLQGTTEKCLVRVILGDTLIKDSFDEESDFVYVTKVEESRRWCLAIIDSRGRITEYINKQDVDIDPKIALAGYYQFEHGSFLNKCVDTCIARGDTELSDVLELYGSMYPISAITAIEWYDFGNIDNLVEARRRLLRPRHFNRLEIDPTLNTITKVSDNNTKLAHELRWYLSLPDSLKVLAPRVVTYDATPDNIRIVQEYYGYPTLAELSVYGDLSSSIWRSILRRVFQIHNLLSQHHGELPQAALKAVYVEKTLKRIEQLAEQNEFWGDLLSQDKITYNSKILLNINFLTEYIYQQAHILSRSTEVAIVHGDFCFSNILFDVNNQIVRLIDPRGEFGEQGIYGDPRYDVAKLRHSVCGKYDFIVADMFQVDIDAGWTFTAEVYNGRSSEVVSSYFDSLVIENGYDLQEIRFIEALLFISMCPLHKDKFNRQLMMYLNGINLLNEVYQCALSST